MLENTIFYCVEETVPVFLIRFYVVAFSPFVPRLEEQDPMLSPFVFYNIKGLFNMLLEVSRCGVDINTLSSSSSRRSIPSWHNHRVDVFPAVFGREKVADHLGVVKSECREKGKMFVEFKPQHPQIFALIEHLTTRFAVRVDCIESQ